MKKFPVGIQLYSVRDALEADFKGTLKMIEEMGYDGVEFAGLYDNSPEDVKKMCDEIGLVPISAHVAVAEFDEGGEQLIIDYKTIGVKQLVVPHIKRGTRPGDEGFPETVAKLKELGALCNKHGLTLAYHNHDFEFVVVDGEYGLDLIYKEVPAELLQTQIDTCWANVGGVNPAEYVRKYTGRAPTVHLKDFVGQKSDKMYALIGVDAGKQEKVDETQAFCLRPVGYGKQDFPAIIAAAEDAGAQWLIVEQDNPSMDKTAMECAKMSIDYLKTINK